LVYKNHLKEKLSKYSWVDACTGRIQYGKSNSALRIASWFNQAERLEDYLTFEPAGLVKLIKQTSSNHAIILDDAGIYYSSAAWQSPESRFLSKALETCGCKHILIIFTVPRLKMIDRVGRMLVDEEIRHIGVGKAEIWNYNEDFGKPRSIVSFPKVDGKVWEQYMDMKVQFIEDVMDELRLAEDLRKQSLSLRQISAITGIPKSTLHHRLKR
jgi:hypothetical protein